MIDDFSSLVVPSWLLVIALYGGSTYLDDLNAMNAAGKRIPGGLSVRIELTGLQLSQIRAQVLDVADTDPEEARALSALLSKSKHLAIRQTAHDLNQRLEGGKRPTIDL